MNITYTTQHWKKVKGTINKETWITQEAQWLCFYHFIQEDNQKEIWDIISWRIGFDKNNNIISFQFKNNYNKEIFQLLDNITIDRCEGLCNELRWEKKPVIVI
jgi:hypothetical protein